MEVVIPTIAIISQCANDPSYQLAIQTEGMIRDIVRHLAAEVSRKIPILWYSEMFFLLGISRIETILC